MCRALASLVMNVGLSPPIQAPACVKAARATGERWRRNQSRQSSLCFACGCDDAPARGHPGILGYAIWEPSWCHDVPWGWDVNRLVVEFQMVPGVYLKQKGNSPPASAEPRSAVQSSQEPLPPYYMASKNIKIDTLLIQGPSVHPYGQSNVTDLHCGQFGKATVPKHTQTNTHSNEVAVRSLQLSVILKCVGALHYKDFRMANDVLFHYYFSKLPPQHGQVQLVIYPRP